MRTDRYRVRRIAGEISTDDIIPARYKHMYTDPAMMAPHVFEARFPGLAATFQVGDVVVSKDIFGVGSSREQAVSALIECGVRAVIAPEFGRIFYRNCWNLGLPAIQSGIELFTEGDTIRIDLERGLFLSSSPEIELPRFPSPSPMMIAMVDAGGLLPLMFSGGTRNTA
ncbi:MAG: 3-isopropylmalate dehydratase small subunit LeuD [Pseudonocardia sp.]|jgi:3-isopropylmalate/(R)-2-methylmalate dehydratase small subunit|nr:3-isopropylmalate dehydratase small subunit LeuD [Pseudonocardia sp.]